jgi:Amt family ammonium transporter
MTSNCFSYDSCLYYNWSVCPSSQIHSSTRYNDVSAGWVLVAAIIVFFMKAGFMLVELSFANDVGEQRRIVIIVNKCVI